MQGTVSVNKTLPAMMDGLPYWVTNSFQVNSGATLTIESGAIVKSGPSYGLKIYGTLNASNVIFTSYKDDSKGGDSNNDGNTTVPARGDWGYFTGGINFSNHANDSLTYCELSYPSQGFYFSNAHAVIDNCLIQQVSDCGIDIFGSSYPAISNCQFNNIQNSPVRLSMFSNPTFTNCNSLNVGRMAITVRPETYSQSATVPIRNFGGYSNITYYMEGTCTINSGTTPTLNFKSILTPI